MENEKRKNKRLQVDGYSVQFNENNLLYTGVVENVSLAGLRVKFCRRNSKLMAERTVSCDKIFLAHNAAEYRIVFSTEPSAAPAESAGQNKPHNGSYVLTASPRWRAKKDDVTIIGFSITRYSEDWRQFVLQILPMRNLLRSGTLLGLPVQRHLPHPFAEFCGINCPEKEYCKDHDEGFAEIALHSAYNSMQVGLP